MYLDSQKTGRDSALYTGWRLENRFRLLMKEHAVNPVLYVEYEDITGADRIFKEVVGNGATVEGDKRKIPTPAQVVDSPSKQFLPRSGFARNQHRRIGWSDARDVFANPCDALAADNFGRIDIRRFSSSRINFERVKPTWVVWRDGTRPSKSSRAMTKSNASAGCIFWLRAAVFSMATMIG